MFLCDDEGEIANNQCAQHRTIIAALDPLSGGQLFPLATSSSMSVKFGRWNLSLIGKLVLASNQQLSSLMQR